MLHSSLAYMQLNQISPTVICITNPIMSIHMSMILIADLSTVDLIAYNLVVYCKVLDIIIYLNQKDVISILDFW